MEHEKIWDLPFGTPAELELHAEWGVLSVLPVEAGGKPRMELNRGASEHLNVAVDNKDGRVRVLLEPLGNFGWFGGWEARATLYVPSDVRANLQTSAGSVHVRDLEGCQLGIKATAGKIDLVNVHGLLHLAADAGSVTGRDVGGYVNVETQAGSVRLEITDLQPGDHRVRAALGEVRLDLARGLDVCIESHTSLGSIHNSFPSREASPARLHLSTEMGSVRVSEGGFSTSSSRMPYPPTSPHASEPRESHRIAESDQELERILKMVEAGELSAREADDLLQAMGRA
jgi:hypothetical protein